MSPSNRLLIWTAFIIVPFTTLAGALPAWLPMAVIIILLFVLLCLYDLWSSINILSPLKLTCPQVIRFTNAKMGSIPLTFHLDTQTWLTQLHLALNTTDNIVSENPYESIQWDAHTDGTAFSLSAQWYCTPKERGSFPLESCDIVTSSKFRFWHIHAKISLQSEMRVYPNLSNERKNLAAIFLNSGALGLHTRRLIGQGREFEKLREYVPGDSMDQIHWKATAKRNTPMTKVTQIEKTQEIYIIIDTSRLSNRPIPIDDSEKSEAQIELFLRAALVMGLVSQKQGDRYGLVTFNSQVRNFLKAGAGTQHFNACKEALYTINAESHTPDFKEVITTLYRKIRKRSLLIFFTNLDDAVLSEAFTEHIEILRRKHLVLVMSIDMAKDAGLFKENTAESIDDIYQHLAEQLSLRTNFELTKNLGKRNIQYLSLKHEVFCLHAVKEYLNVKGRQLL